MTWLTWRQLRAQAAAAVAAATGVVVVLVVTGRRLHDLAVSGSAIYDLLRPSDRTLWFVGAVVVAVVPALLGAFWGAPLVARELESGTHRLAWNQGVTRTRWLATKLLLTTAVSAVVVGLLSAAVTWWAWPVDGSTSQTQGGLPGRLTPIAFAMRGTVPVAYAVFAVVLGAALGLVLRRTLPAMALTLLVFTLVQVAVPLWVRPHLVPADHAVVALTARPVDSISLDHPGGVVTIGLSAPDHGDWVVVNRTLGPDGRPAAIPAWFTTCTDSPVGSGTTTSGASTTQVSADSCLARLAGEGYRQEMVVVPASRFWGLQVTETALYLVVSGLLAAGCFWWLRRRMG